MKKIISLLLVFIFSIVSFTSLTVSAKEDYSYKLESNLKNKLERIMDSEKIFVSLWLNDINKDELKKKVYNKLENKISKASLALALEPNSNDSIKYINEEKKQSQKSLEKESNEIQTVIEVKRSIYREMQKEKSSIVLKNELKEYQDNILYISKYLPNIDIELTRSQILDLTKSNNINKIELLDGIKPFVTLNESKQNRSVEEELNEYKYEITGINDLKNIRHLNGNGVKIGSIEWKLCDINADCFEEARNENRIFAYGTGEAPQSHQTLTSAVMVGKIDGRFEGVAPKAELHCATQYEPDNNGNYTLSSIHFKNCTELLLSKGVNLINASTYMAFSPYADGFSNYGACAAWIDALINTQNVSIIQSAGNNGEDGVIPGATAFNSIVVGNIGSNGEVNSSSSYNTGNQYKPDISAPGYGGVLFSNATNASFYPCSGTSCSAPMVTGIAALICQAVPSLKTNPLLLKTIILNGSEYMGIENTAGNVSAFNAYDRQTGAGLINGEKSLCCYLSYNWFNTSFNKNDVSITSVSVDHSKKPVHVTVCGIRSNTFSSPNDIPNANVTLGSSPLFKVEVTCTSNSNYKYISQCTFDNKCSVVFTPPVSGYYSVKITRIDPFVNFIGNVAATYISQ